jgi:hypothetical protein
MALPAKSAHASAVHWAMASMRRRAGARDFMAEEADAGWRE